MPLMNKHSDITCFKGGVNKIRPGTLFLVN